MSTSRDIFMFSRSEDIMIQVGGYHEYILGNSVGGYYLFMWRNSLKKPFVLHEKYQCTEHPRCTRDIPHMSDDIPSHESWYLSNVLSIP